MSSTTDENLAYVNYYLKRKWFKHVVNYCDSKLKMSISDPYLILWKSVALSQSGNATLAVQELAPLEEKRDFILVWHLAMIFAHKKCKYVDTEAVAQLEAKYTIASTSANISDKALTLAGLFYWHTGEVDQAVSFLKNALVKNANNISAMVGLGWIEVESKNSTTTNWFNHSLEKSMRDIEAMLGQCSLLRKQRKAGAALEISNRIIAYYPNFIPALVERMYILMEMLSWDAVLEAAQRLGGSSPDNIDSLVVLAWYEICTEGASQSAAIYLRTLRKGIEKMEPENAEILFELARPFVRLADRNFQVLEECETMIKSALSLKQDDSKLYLEMGYIYYLMNDLEKSKENYERASKIDPHNIQALEGVIRWLIYTEQYQAAQSQLEMFVELQRATGKSANIAYLNSMIALKSQKDYEKWLVHLKDALQIQLKAVQGQTITIKYYVLFNPEFILSIIRTYIDSGIWQQLPPDESDSFQRIIRDILEILLRIVPGSTEALYFIARTHLLLGDPVSAETQLQKAINKNKTDLKAYILLCEIHVGNRNFKAALTSLEMALSFDFSIRQDLSFLLLKAKCLVGQESFQEGLTVMKTAFNLMSVREAISAFETGQEWKKSPSKVQMAQLFLRLMECQAATDREALVGTMQQALRIFKGTMQESMFVLVDAKEKLNSGDINGALETLGSIKPDQISYLEARSIMADVYLNKKHDRKRYASCFKEIVEKRPTVESCLMLGDAFMKIQEPLEAIKVYQTALTTYPDQTVFVGKIGNAYVMMHDYGMALSYYKAAIVSASDKMQLQHDLASLLYRLRKYDDAGAVVHEAIEAVKSHDYPTLLESNIKKLQAKIFIALDQHSLATTSYMNAKDTLLRLLSSETGKQAEQLQIEISNICTDLGILAETHMKDLERAGTYYSEALQFNADNQKASLAFAKLQIKQGNHSAAQNQLANILEKKNNSVEASILMAELLCEKSSFQAAFFHYRQVLEKSPANFEFLANFIDLAYRLDKLDEAEPYFEYAQKASLKSKVNIGFHYCRGLFFRYSNSLNDAMKQFVICRTDSVWGERALHQLIEIFLNPGDEIIGGEALVGAIDANESPNDLNANMDMTSVFTADKLIMQLPQEPKSLKTKIFECQAMMASKEKAEIEKAVGIMMDMLKAEPDYIPAIYGTSVGFMLLKQSPRARNQLKRVSKMEWTKRTGEDIEKCWILLADIYIQGGKYDLATELLKKVTAVNLSCSKAWEYLGFIMEKEQSYQDAAEYYAKCWKLQRKSNPSIGFKLAFNYLKAKRYTDAIDISHLVLKTEPNYPKIKSEILDKSRAALRC